MSQKVASRLAAAVLAVSLSACSSGSEGTKGSSEETGVAAGEDSSASAPEILAFGKTYTYPSGLAVTVESPKPQPDAASRDALPGVDTPVGRAKVKITVANGTSAPVDLSLSLQVYSGEEEGGYILSEGDYPDGVIPKGRKRSGTNLLYAADTNDILLTVSPSTEQMPITYSTNPTG